MTARMEEKRPEWPHQTPEDLARWLVGHRVTKITHHWEFTGEDTSRHWIELHADKEKRAVASGFLEHNREFVFRPDHAGLICEAPYGKVRSTIETIDKWEKANARDRSEYARLQKKFAAR
jgi:hypothetical protein